MAGFKPRWPWVGILFAAVVVFSTVAFYSRGTAYLRWSRGESIGSWGFMSYVWAIVAFGPFVVLIALAPNPELSDRVPRRVRLRQILMFLAIGIIFCLEVFFLTF